MSSESNKQKIARIYDTFPQSSKENIAKILQYYEDDENRAIDALTQDGGQEALSSFTDSGSLKNKNKNKKKKKKGRKDLCQGSSAATSFDADDSSSLHSGGNIDTELEKECSSSENRNGIGEKSVENPEERLKSPVKESSSMESSAEIKSSQKEHIPLSPGSIAREESHASDGGERADDSSGKKDKFRSIRDEKHSSRTRTNSFRRSKTSSLSEDSSSQCNIQSTAMPTKRGYEKCKKDLYRQTVFLQKIHTNVDAALEESAKKLKNVFADLQKMLEKRQEQIEQELEKTKEDALKLLKSRQDQAVELKRRVDRTQSLTEAEWSELRSDIKLFVTERKYDDELGRTIWFQWSMDAITDAVNSFGEVLPVKNVYSHRSHSLSNNHPEPSPSSSLVNEDIDSATDKTDVARLDTVEDEVPVPAKIIPAPKNPSIGSRVFSNKQYLASRGENRGGYRGGRGGYNRPNKNNYYRHSYYNDYSNDYRDNSNSYSNDRNAHKNERQMRRSHHYSYSNRYRPSNSNQQQHSSNNNNSTTVSKSTDPVNAESENVINGV